MTGLIGDDALEDTGRGCRGRKTGPQWFEPDTTLLVDSDRRLLRIVGSRPIDAPEQALSWWGRANPDAVYDSELFRREILPRLATVKLSETAEATGCSKAYAPEIAGSWCERASQGPPGGGKPLENGG